jgi:hypothetical protein
VRNIGGRVVARMPIFQRPECMAAFKECKKTDAQERESHYQQMGNLVVVPQHGSSAGRTGIGGEPVRDYAH